MRTAGRWLAVVAVVCIGVVTFVWWRWAREPGGRPLEPDWTPVVIAIAGDGNAGFRDGELGRGQFSDPFGVAPAADGTIYVADAGVAQRIRRIAPDGMVSTLAGSERGYTDGPGASARFDTPSGLAVGAAGDVYVADTGNNAIRRISPDGIVATLTRDPEVNGPVGVAVDAAGRVIVADTYNDRIRAIEPDGHVVTIAGSGRPGAVDGPAAEARFHTPCGVAADAAGNIYVADTGNDAVRRISPGGVVSTLGPLPPYGIIRPIGIAATADGVIYVTEDGGRIVEITAGRGVRTLAGSRPGFADGRGAGARFRGLTGLALAAPGRLIASDSRNALIRLVAAPSHLELRRPPPPRLRPDFDAEAFAWQPLLWPLAPMDGPFEITGTLGELRGGDGAGRLHAGIDVHAPEGTPVRVVRSAVVTDPVAAVDFETLNESIRIGPLAYVHLRVGRMGRYTDAIDPARFVTTHDETGHIVLVRAKRGARFISGETIGTVNAFNHVHLNVGWPGEEHNPLRLRLTQFQDHRPPTIRRGGIRLFRDDGAPIVERKNGRLIVDGLVQVVVDAWDQVDGNERRRRLGLYRLGYQVLNKDGSPAPGFLTPRETIVFNRFGGSEAARTVYASGSGIPYFGRRSTRFFYVVTNTLRDGVAAVDRWDTRLLTAGDYTLRVLAADVAGNEAAANRDLRITIAAPP
jgi:DNA-binding beta-propeller fold protein YncE